jgi:hypothetical protein
MPGTQAKQNAGAVAGFPGRGDGPKCNSLMAVALVATHRPRRRRRRPAVSVALTLEIVNVVRDSSMSVQPQLGLSGCRRRRPCHRRRRRRG